MTEEEKEAEYQSRKMIIYSNGSKIKDYINNPYSKNSITITFNSLTKIENHINNAPTDNPFVSYLDEASRSIPYSLSCCTLDNICKDTQRTLRNTIKKAKKVVITDGTIDEPLMKFVSGPPQSPIRSLEVSGSQTDLLVQRAGRDHPFPIFAGSPWRERDVARRMRHGWPAFPGKKTTGIEPHPAHAFPTAGRLWRSVPPPLSG